ncbi:hypothetical protein AAFF_G00262500 [Aldrovandia affinis]|uniref:Uncharacterized protein n=1 Tax=Aldrovandia affinis TaxID=143900 RepID=A0AAD7STR6_9TELE|nr:hypothetical protein AAFF_G00262500 [Aldrovandia affinis]
MTSLCTLPASIKPSNLHQLFQRITSTDLRLNPAKCNLFCHETSFLGHVLGPDGISMDPVKVKAVRRWLVPSSKTEVCSFLGQASCSQCLIAGSADIYCPLHILTEKAQPFQWNHQLPVCLQPAPGSPHPGSSASPARPH